MITLKFPYESNTYGIGKWMLMDTCMCVSNYIIDNQMTVRDKTELQWKQLEFIGSSFHGFPTNDKS